MRVFLFYENFIIKLVKNRYKLMKNVFLLKKIIGNTI
jgi:hypothetical protein